MEDNGEAKSVDDSVDESSVQSGGQVDSELPETANLETANTDAEEQRAKEEERRVFDLRSEFVSWLGCALSQTQKETQYKATTSGLFFVEEAFQNTLELFQTWHAEHRSGSLSIEKAVQKLFGTEYPALFYVVLGKQSQIGFLISCNVQSPQKLGFPLYKGAPLEALSYIHPRDTSLGEVEGIRVSTGQLGFELEVVCGKFSYQFDLDSLKLCAKILRGSAPTVKRYPAIMRSLRDVVRQLPVILSKFRPHKKSIPLLIPAQFRKSKECRFLRLGELVMVKEASKVLCLYELKGRNRRHFFQEELNSLSRLKKGRFGKFRMNKDPIKMLGSYQGERHRFLCPVGMFHEFVESLSHGRVLKKKIPSYYTLYDALMLFLKLFDNSSIVDSRDVSRYLPPKLKGKVSEARIKEGVVFIIQRSKGKSSDKIITTITEHVAKKEKAVVIKTKVPETGESHV